MSVYTKAVEACLSEVGQPLPDWGEMNSASFPGDLDDWEGFGVWSAAMGKAGELCAHLYDMNIDGESSGDVAAMEDQ